MPEAETGIRLEDGRGQRHDVDVHHLAARVHPGVRAARHDHGLRHRRPRRLPLEGLLQDTLDRAAARLAGPAREVRAVVGDVQTQTNEPAVPSGEGGLVRNGFRRQDSSSCCDGGSEKPAASAASAEANHTSALVCS